MSDLLPKVARHPQGKAPRTVRKNCIEYGENRKAYECVRGPYADSPAHPGRLATISRANGLSLDD